MTKNTKFSEYFLRTQMKKQLTKHTSRIAPNTKIFHYIGTCNLSAQRIKKTSKCLHCKFYNNQSSIKIIKMNFLKFLLNCSYFLLFYNINKYESTQSPQNKKKNKKIK